jgi:hypothetical protein
MPHETALVDRYELYDVGNLFSGVTTVHLAFKCQSKPEKGTNSVKSPVKEKILNKLF